MKKYDVFIIGSGMSGMTIANKCASKGLSVGITDELPYGGTCALRGCDPKKVIIGATEVRDFAKRLKGKGIDTIPNINWRDIPYSTRKLYFFTDQHRSPMAAPFSMPAPPF